MTRLHLLILTFVERLYPLADRYVTELERSRDRTGAAFVRESLAKAIPMVTKTGTTTDALCEGAAVCRRWADALIRRLEKNGLEDEARSAAMVITDADRQLIASLGRTG